MNYCHSNLIKHHIDSSEEIPTVYSFFYNIIAWQVIKCMVYYIYSKGDDSYANKKHE